MRPAGSLGSLGSISYLISFRCVGEGEVTITETARSGGGVGKVLRVRGPSGMPLFDVYGYATRCTHTRMYILSTTLHHTCPPDYAKGKRSRCPPWTAGRLAWSRSTTRRVTSLPPSLPSTHQRSTYAPDTPTRQLTTPHAMPMPYATTHTYTQLYV